jgi:hypothetical protein
MECGFPPQRRGWEHFLGKRRIEGGFLLAQALFGEPTATPDQVRGRPEHALGSGAAN